MNVIKCCPPLLIFDRYRDFSENRFAKIKLPYPNDNVWLFRNEHLLQQMARNTENHSQSECKLWNPVPTNIFIIQLPNLQLRGSLQKMVQKYCKSQRNRKNAIRLCFLKNIKRATPWILINMTIKKRPNQGQC